MDYLTVTIFFLSSIKLRLKYNEARLVNEKI